MQINFSQSFPKPTSLLWYVAIAKSEITQLKWKHSAFVNETHELGLKNAKAQRIEKIFSVPVTTEK